MLRVGMAPELKCDLNWARPNFIEAVYRMYVFGTWLPSTVRNPTHVQQTLYLEAIANNGWLKHNEDDTF